MAKFCKYCGNPLEEGQVCTCAQAQAEAGAAQAPAAPVAPVAPAAPAQSSEFVQKAKSLFTEAKDILVSYFKAPQTAIQTAMYSPNHLGLAGVFAGANALAVLLLIWRILAQSIGTVAGIASAIGGDLKVSYPFLAMLVSAIALAVVFIGMSGLALFAAGKITKRAMEIKYAMVIASVQSIYITALVLVGIVLGFLAWQIEALCLVLAALVWVSNGLTDLSDYTSLKANTSLKSMTVVVALMVVVVIVCGFATSKLLGWTVGEVSVMGQKLSAIADNLGNISDIIGDIF